MAMREWLLKDKAWKFFSLILAVSIWLIVNKIRGESPTPSAEGQRTLPLGNVPVSVVSASSDVRGFRVDPASVAIAVAGPPDLLSNLQPFQIHAFVDLTDAKIVNLSGQPVNVTVPSGLRFVAVNPSKVRVIMPPANE
jgi:YbbR domain-containing protein